MRPILKQIKQNVWQKNTDGKLSCIKKYEDKEIYHKVTNIHLKLTEIQFPFILPMKSDELKFTIEQPWQEGEGAQTFATMKQREIAWKVVNELHKTKKQVYWENESYLKVLDLKKKWLYRIAQFEKNAPWIAQYVGHITVREWISNAKKVMDSLPDIPFRASTLLHGDIVHHNFIFKENSAFLIDFDLACVGNPNEELILLLHRFLPHYNYDHEKLLKQFPEAEQYLSFLAFPNELMREWIYVAKLPAFEQIYALRKLQVFTNSALPYYEKIWYN